MANKREDLVASFEFDLIKGFKGYNSSRDKTNIALDFLVQGSQNVYKKISGTIAVRPGMKRRGVADNTYSPISSQYVWNTSWGATLPLEITNNTLRVEYNGAYYTLMTGLTSTRYVFGKWFSTTEQKDRVLFVNGDANIYNWSGGMAQVASVTTNTITKTNPSISWQQAGFSTVSLEKSILINGTTYTYTGGENTATLTGVSPDPTGTVAGTVVAQKVLIATTGTGAGNTFPGPKNDFLKVINNQVYVGSYTSRTCYISSSTDWKNYTVPTPRVAGSPELLVLDAALTGIGVRQGNAHISMNNGNWAKVTFTDITVGTTLAQKTTVDVLPGARQTSAYAHEFIENVGDTLLFLSQDQQLRTIGDFATLFATAFPSFSQDVYTELQAENFIGGGLKCVGDYTYLTAPNSGKTYLYQVRQSVNEFGQIISERIWHPPQIWNITRVDVINGVVYGYSNANPQVYQLWDTGQYYDDSPSDEQLPYKCVFSSPYNDKGRRQGMLSFDKLFTEGYIAQGTDLMATIRYDYNGNKAVLSAVVNNSDQSAYTFTGQNPASLGDSSLGDNPIGDTLTTSTPTIPKFKNINSFSLENTFEYQIEYSSEKANANWEILAYGTNAFAEKQQQSTFIMNKLKR